MGMIGIWINDNTHFKYWLLMPEVIQKEIKDAMGELARARIENFIAKDDSQ